MLPQDKWQQVTQCPLCSTQNTLPQAKIKELIYQCGTQIIPLPGEEVKIIKCNSCKIYYKNIIPSLSFLLDIYNTQSENIWTEPYNFINESKLLKELTQNHPFDILDIGSGNGQLLKALDNADGRKSALDIVQYPGIKTYLKGEFIQNTIDAPNLSWSGQQYDVVTMFDVLEHLYNPINVFQNLVSLVKDNGYVLIETGDTDSYWPQRYGIESWWYTSFFEHHIFWNRDALKKIAEDYGFKTVHYESKKHKSQSGVIRNVQKMKILLNLICYIFNPNIYHKISKLLGKSGIQPWSPFTNDHLLIILQKKPSIFPHD